MSKCGNINLLSSYGNFFLAAFIFYIQCFAVEHCLNDKSFTVNYNALTYIKDCELLENV